MSLPNPEELGKAFAIMDSHDQVAFFEAVVKEAGAWGPLGANSQWYWIGSLLRDEKEHGGVREMIDMIHHAMHFKPTPQPGVGTSSSGSLPEETPEIDLDEPFLEIP